MEEGPRGVSGPLRTVFMGTPDFAAPSLRALVAAGHDVVAVYTQPPRPAGRGQRNRQSAIHTLAVDLGIPVRHPARLRDADEQAAFAALDADVAVVAAYGLILPKPVLTAPRLGCINVHASLLPRWRGAAPIHRAILAGDEVTGVTIMMMAEGLDTGDMLASAAVPITADATTPALHDTLAGLGADLLPGVLGDLADGAITPVAQPETGVTYAGKITRAEGLIDWSSAAFADRQVRALSPFPGAWFEHAGEAIKVSRCELADIPETAGSAPPAPGAVLDDRLTIACGDGKAIRLLELQRPGRSKADSASFLRGYPHLLGVGVILGGAAPADGGMPDTKR